MKTPRIFPDSCVLIEGLVAPWSASRGVLILGRAALLNFVVAEVVVEETERAIAAKFGIGYGGRQRLLDDLQFLLQRLRVERIPHVSAIEFQDARKLIRHTNDVPVIAAATKAKPDWLLTINVSHFNTEVTKRTGLRIVTPAAFLDTAGRLLTA